jgi:NADPH:quinone reductase-like Zn-dependent oxidoreductase
MSTDSMRAVRVHQFGGPEVLKVEHIPRHNPQAGEVLLRVHAAGVLPADCKMRVGFFRCIHPVHFPYIPSSAVSGVVEEVGPGVTRFKKGDAVFGRSINGASAEFITTAVETTMLNPTLVIKPASISFDEAATVSGSATTAYWNLFDDAELQAGQRVLIQGAAGGVGLYAVQLAKWAGAEVIGTTSTANVAFVRSLGADTVIDYTTTRFEDVAKEIDLVFDTVGGETLHRSMAVVKPGGKLLSIVEEPSQEQAAELGIDAHFFKTLTSHDVLETLAPLLEKGVIKPHVGATFALEEVRQAHELCETGHGRGRIVLHVADA